VKRLKVPPAIHQFTSALDKNAAQALFSLLDKYKPESKQEKAARLRQLAADKLAGKVVAALPKPNTVKFGLNHVTALVEQKKAKLVVLAHDVDPIELVLWLPTLCRKKGVPWLIVKGKSRLGQVVHQKTAAAVALVDVDAKDKKDLADLIQRSQDNFVARYSRQMKTGGGGVMGPKHQSKKAKYQRKVAREAAGLAKEQEKKAKRQEKERADAAAKDTTTKEKKEEKKEAPKKEAPKKEEKEVSLCG